MSGQLRPKITIEAWAVTRWNPPPSRATLYRLIRNANIHPTPEKVGRTYYVNADATLVDRDGRPLDEISYKFVTPEQWIRQCMAKPKSRRNAQR